MLNVLGHAICGIDYLRHWALCLGQLACGSSYGESLFQWFSILYFGLLFLGHPLQWWCGFSLVLLHVLLIQVLPVFHLWCDETINHILIKRRIVCCYFPLPMHQHPPVFVLQDGILLDDVFCCNDKATCCTWLPYRCRLVIEDLGSI